MTMREDTAEATAVSTVVWASLEEFARLKVQELIQALLEEEVTALLGRTRSQRREGLEGKPGYRNGYGKPRQLCTSMGTVAVRRPRVRGLEERFESRILPLFQWRTAGVDRLLPELYLHGLSAGDFDRALRGLLGEAAPISASTLLRLRQS